MGDFVAKLILQNGRVVELNGPADITKETTEAIVNAANSHLAGGGGVDGAIHRAGGPSILEECQRIIKKIGQLPAGKAVMTTAGRLPAKYVIHAVGPRYRNGGAREAQTLASCYSESLRIADDHQIGSISFPSISTGMYGYPVTEAACVAIRSVADSLTAASHVSRVRFVLFDNDTCQAYVQAAQDFCQNSKTVLFEKGPS